MSATNSVKDLDSNDKLEAINKEIKYGNELGNYNLQDTLGRILDELKIISKHLKKINE